MLSSFQKVASIRSARIRKGRQWISTITRKMGNLGRYSLTNHEHYGNMDTESSFKKLKNEKATSKNRRRKDRLHSQRESRPAVHRGS